MHLSEYDRVLLWNKPFLPPKKFKRILAIVKDRKMSAFWIIYRQILSKFLFIIKR